MVAKPLDDGKSGLVAGEVFEFVRVVAPVE
jgi:hypothetical protein